MYVDLSAHIEGRMLLGLVPENKMYHCSYIAEYYIENIPQIEHVMQDLRAGSEVFYKGVVYEMCRDQTKNILHEIV